MTKKELIAQIHEKSSYLCVGLDTDINKIPSFLRSHADPIFSFNKAIIDATLPYAVSYKINTAFYEAQGASGWESMQKTIAYLPEQVLCIADAKRGDIGNTVAQYAHSFFEELAVDAITVAPYMGRDSVEPFLAYRNRWTILLALTSNPSSQDFEMLELANGNRLYEEVIEQSKNWGSDEQLMYVVGATQSDYLSAIRKRIPHYFMLVPGVGAQGGDLDTVSRLLMTQEVGLLINSSRSIIYASQAEDFATKAALAAKDLQLQMASCLQKYL
ncbi:MAG: orotidine-5'-phosphate decarboxylase [Bernardetiaceae bacterium]|nr:orotidine-5'-phosphate decarboxylase [Bernardetiaceae bacterium]